MFGIKPTLLENIIHPVTVVMIVQESYMNTIPMAMSQLPASYDGTFI